MHLFIYCLDWIGLDSLFIDLFQFIRESQSKKATQLTKGLRHFGLRVCETVKAMNATTYAEVGEIQSGGGGGH